jgi:hypothetical protein
MTLEGRIISGYPLPYLNISTYVLVCQTDLQPALWSRIGGWKQHQILKHSPATHKGERHE